MKQLLCSVIFALPLYLMAQIDYSNKGIQWTKGLNWDQLKSKAKKENKLIFIDCYTTWCVPCKRMDFEVYNSAKIAEYVNKKFISIRMQMDSAKNDEEYVKAMYNQASEFKKIYKINSYPTFLFFSSDGAIVDRGMGFKNAICFLDLERMASSSEQQFYTSVNKYYSGQINYSSIPALIQKAQALGEVITANNLAKDYLQNYLYLLQDDSLLLKKNIQFIGSYLQTSREKGFLLFYENGHKIDSIVRYKGYSQLVVDNIIRRETIDSYLWSDNKFTPKTSTPPWNKIYKKVSKKYGPNNAERLVINSKVIFYSVTKDWHQFAESLVQKNDKFGLDTVGINKFLLNNMIWDVIFLHSNDKRIINKGISYMETLLKLDPNSQIWLDTYANLLYKSGQISSALEWESRALRIEEEKAAKGNRPIDPSYEQILQKMKKGIPTW